MNGAMLKIDYMWQWHAEPAQQESIENAGTLIVNL